MSTLERIEEIIGPTPQHIDEIIKMRKNGSTLREIGEKFGVSKQRIDQILTKNGRVYPNLISTRKLAEISGCSKYMVEKLESRGLIKPAHLAGDSSYIWKLWENKPLQEVVPEMDAYYVRRRR